VVFINDNRRFMMLTKNKLLPLFLGLAIAVAGVNTLENQVQAKNEKLEETTVQKVAQITKIESLNAITLQVTFNKPLSNEEVDPNNLEGIKTYFEFDQGLSIVNVPRLKTGAKSTYILPVTVQNPGTKYTLQYKGQKVKSFKGSDEKINIRQAQQVTNDTFELESFLEDGVTDYANIIEAYKAGRGDLAFEVDDKNRANGKQYQVISSLRDRVVTITSDQGEKIVANYVPFTQAADGRQAPKFRLPAGQVLKPGTTYAVTSDWASVKNNSFTAIEIAPLTIQTAEPINNKSFTITLVQDPGSELFAGRRVSLVGDDGTTLEAQYRFQSRKGAVGIFDLDNSTLKSGVKYTVQPLNSWAVADTVQFLAK
jgi:hypothetical protein